MMLHRCRHFIVVARAVSTTAACMVALGGCAPTTPAWESRFGDASRQLKAQQLVDPAAPRRNAAQQPPADGATVRENMVRYLESSQTPPAPTIINNIGTGTGR